MISIFYYMRCQENDYIIFCDYVLPTKSNVGIIQKAVLANCDPFSDIASTIKDPGINQDLFTC